MIGSLLKDFRVAARVLLRSPGFSLVAILTIGIALGANAAIFSVVNGVLVRPLPYPDDQELVTFSVDASLAGAPELPLSPAGYWHFFEKARSFDSFGAHISTIFPLVGDEGNPEQITVGIMTWSVFPTLGVSPIQGRAFTEEEDLPGGPNVALVSEELWSTRFGSDPDMIGSTINVNGATWEVIGIMPNDFDFPSPNESVWIPARIDPATQNFGGHSFTPIARMAEGVTVETAETEVIELVARFDEVGYGPAWFNGVFTGDANAEGLRDSIVGDSSRPLVIIFGAVAMVLLIACSNVANLFLVRTRSRMRETAVRSAMGARKGQLIQYTLAESSVIGLASGALGLLLAWAGTRALVAVQPGSIPRLEEIGVDGAVIGFVLGITLLASILLGIVPALKSGSIPVSKTLRDGGRSGTAGRESQVLRGVLVVSQVALAVLLLVGSGLMVRSAQALGDVNPGFDTEGVLRFSISLPPATYQPGDGTAQFFSSLLESVRGMPGVVSAGATEGLPLNGGAFLATQAEDRPLGQDEFPPAFHRRRITPGYLETLGIPVIDGRDFSNLDHQNRLGTTIIGQAVADQFWPGESALGRRIAPSTQGFVEVVGVVPNIHQSSLENPEEGLVYLPMVDSIGGGVTQMTIVARADGDPLTLIPAIRAEIERRDPNLPITNLGLLDEIVSDSIANTTFTTFVLSIAAVIALILGSVGIYGLISYIVGQRTPEIGIRMSMGADPPSVRKLFLFQGWALTGTGIAVGLIAAALGARLLTTLIYGVSPFDVMTFIVAPIVFFTIATLACLIPASRAAAVDPAIAFRAK